jgi:hypothetical protein
MTNDLVVVLWPIEKPIPYARNARKISDRAVDKVAASIKEFGWRQPIVVDRENVIIVGHARLLAAKKLGLQSVPIHVAENLTPTQVKAYRLMDNRSHEETDWDWNWISVSRALTARKSIECYSPPGMTTKRPTPPRRSQPSPSRRQVTCGTAGRIGFFLATQPARKQ